MSAMVGAIVPDRELAETISAVAHIMGQEVPCVETTPEGLVGALRMIEPHGVRAIISSGRLPELLRTATTIPIVQCNPSSYDLVLSLFRARRLSRKIALLHFGPSPVDVGELGDMLDARIGEFQSGRSSQEVRKTLDQVKSEGFEVLISGPAIATIARGFGLSAVHVRAGRVTVQESLESAFSLVKAQESGEVRALASQAAIESAGLGVMVTQKDGAIVLMNSLARELSGANTAQSAEEVIGKPGWDRLVTGGHGAFCVFGQNRAIAEMHIPARARDLRTLTLFDPPLLRRLLAGTTEDLPLRSDTSTFEDLVAVSFTMGAVIARAQDLARSDDNIVIYGEAGSGKNSFAQAIHSQSRRKRAQFYRLNALLPEETVMADLVGAPASPGEPTLLERSHGGTVYVHECWNLSEKAQKILLEVVERKSLYRADGSRIPCDIRVILGSSRPMKDLLESGRVLAELYHRTAAQVLRLPPLRDRQEDIVPLLERFLKREGVAEVSASPSFERRLLAYRWPGNCTELRNFASRLASLYRSFPSASRISLEKTAFDEMESEMPRSPSEANGALVLKPGSMEFLEEQIIEQMDRLVGGNKSELARRLGVSRTTLWKKTRVADKKPPSAEQSDE